MLIFAEGVKIIQPLSVNNGDSIAENINIKGKEKYKRNNQKRLGYLGV